MVLFNDSTEIRMILARSTENYFCPFDSSTFEIPQIVSESGENMESHSFWNPLHLPLPEDVATQLENDPIQPLLQNIAKGS